jgi:hypothetical protein
MHIILLQHHIYPYMHALINIIQIYKCY